MVRRASGETVDRVLLEADNGSRGYAFRLISTIRIDEVVVQVCRRTQVPGPPA